MPYAEVLRRAHPASRSASRARIPTSPTRAGTASPSATSDATTTARRGEPIPGYRRRGSRRERETARLAGTVGDLAAFLRALLDEGHGLMAPDSFELMTTRSIEADDGWRYGYGLEVRERGGRREIRHSGSMPGFGARMLGDRDAGSESRWPATEPTRRTSSRGSRRRSWTCSGTASTRPPSPIRSPSVDAADYEGFYAGEAGRLELVAEGDRLFLAGVTSEPLEPRSSPGRFLVDHPIFALFLLDFRRADGRVVEAVHGGNVYRREGAAATGPPATPPEWSAYPGHYRAYNPWYLELPCRSARGRADRDLPVGLGVAAGAASGRGFRLGSEEWWPERLRFDAIVDGAAQRVDVERREAYYRVPLDVVARKPVRPGPREDARATARRPRA